MSAELRSATAWALPDPIPTRFETDRFVLRVFDGADAVALWMAIDESRPTLLPWLPWAREDHRSLAETHHTIEKFRRELGKPAFEAGRLNVVLGVFDRGSGRLLGGSGFHTFRPGVHQAEIGYWLRTSERGRGVCTAATAATVSWGFMPVARGGWGLRRLEILCAGGNPSSAGVGRRLGLREESRTRADRWIDGRGLDDTLTFGVLAEEWDVEGMRKR